MGSGGLGKEAEGYFTHLTRSSVDKNISSKNPVRGQTKFGISGGGAFCNGARRWRRRRQWRRAATAP